VTHFYKSTKNFDNEPDKVELVCKIGKGCKFSCKLGEFTNLNKHLLIHPESRAWYHSYRSWNKNFKYGLTNGQLNLVKFFVSSYQILSDLQNQHFRQLIDSSIKIPSYVYFRNSFLPEVCEMLSKELETKLKEAKYVTIIPDVWEYNFVHRLGLGATLVYDSFQTDLVILGIEVIAGSSAEEVKPVIESIINRYSFDKNKITGSFYCFLLIVRLNHCCMLQLWCVTKVATLFVFLTKHLSITHQRLQMMAIVVEKQ
jgi:hypothetical protein